MLLFAVQLIQGIQYLCFALMFGGMLLLNRKDRSIFWLFCNYLLGSAGLLLMQARIHETAWISNWAGMEIPQIRYALLHLAILSFVRSHRWTRWVGAVMAVAALPLYVLWSGSGYQDPAFATKNFALLDIALCVQTAVSGWVILRNEENETRLPRLAIGACLFLYSFTELTRFGIVISTGRAPLQIAPWIEMASLVVFVTASSSTPVGFIWMLNQRLLAEFKRQSVVDSLTGLLNRRGLLQASERELLQAGRTGKPLSVVIADIDHFKLFNDRYGHATGDIVLRETAGVFQSILRKNDLLARLGGEEFVLVLLGTNEEAAAVLVERLRAAVEARSISIDGHDANITVSFGITALRGRRDVPLHPLLEEADIALYAAKQAGRNQARLYMSEMGKGGGQKSVLGIPLFS